MAIKAGVWIDHKQAIVVLITDAGQEIKKFKSGGEQPARPVDGSRSKNKHTPNDFIAEDRRERKLVDDRKKVYEHVLASIRGADSLLVLGPGEAKGEFSKHILSKKRRGLAPARRDHHRNGAASLLEGRRLICAEREKRATITKAEGDREAASNSALAAKIMGSSPGAMQLRTWQTIDGLGPTASNTVVLAVPIDVMDAVNAFAREHNHGNGRLAGFTNDPASMVVVEKTPVACNES